MPLQGDAWRRQEEKAKVILGPRITPVPHQAVLLRTPVPEELRAAEGVAGLLSQGLSNGADVTAFHPKPSCETESWAGDFLERTLLPFMHVNGRGTDRDGDRKTCWHLACRLTGRC